MKVGIIGGGITGLTIAYYLSKRGIDVTVFEKDQTLGGLAGSIKLEDTYLEKYYHHIFMSDDHVLRLADELHIREEVVWHTTEMGFFCEGRIYPFNTPIDLLNFRPITPLERIRLGFVILYLQRLRNWTHLDGIDAKTWLSRSNGKNAYKRVWEPLLKTKFGNSTEDISAAWIWGRLKPRAQSRDVLGKERLGYIRGGFHKLVDALERSILNNGGRLIKGEEMVNLKPIGGRSIELLSRGGIAHEFDKVVSTVPTPILMNFIKEHIPGNYMKKLSCVDYMGIVCMILRLRRPLSSIYWLNVCDRDIPFGGVIEHTNFVPKEDYEGWNVVYLFNYSDKNQSIYRMPDDKLFEVYVKGLEKLYPEFMQDWVKDYTVSRNAFGTPIYTRYYSKKIPDIETPIKNLYMVNTSQIYPQDRNINSSIGLGYNSISKIIK